MDYTAREMVVLGTLDMVKDEMHKALDINENMTLAEYIKVFAAKCRSIELLMQQMRQPAKEEPKS